MTHWEGGRQRVLNNFRVATSTGSLCRHEFAMTKPEATAELPCHHHLSRSRPPRAQLNTTGDGEASFMVSGDNHDWHMRFAVEDSLES